MKVRTLFCTAVVDFQNNELPTGIDNKLLQFEENCYVVAINLTLQRSCRRFKYSIKLVGSILDSSAHMSLEYSHQVLGCNSVHAQALNNKKITVVNVLWHEGKYRGLYNYRSLGMFLLRAFRTPQSNEEINKTLSLCNEFQNRSKYIQTSNINHLIRIIFE